MKKIFFIPLLITLSVLIAKGQDNEIQGSLNEIQIKTDSNSTLVTLKATDNLLSNLMKLHKMRNYELDDMVMAVDTPPNDSGETIIIRTIESDSGDIMEVIVKDSNGKIKRTIRVEEDMWDAFEDLFDSKTMTFKQRGRSITVRPKKRNSNVETDWFSLDIGFNNFLFEGNTSLPSQFSNLELNPSRSLHVNVGIFQQKINLFKHYVGLVYGINYDNNDYRFSNDIDFKVTDAGDSISYLGRQTEGFDRNKLTTRFLTVPVALRFDFNPKKRRGGHITIGAHAGYRLTSFFKTVRFDGGKQKEKFRDDFLLNNIRYGAFVKIGYGRLNVFGNYILTPMFRENTAPVLNTFSFGLSFGGF